ncbi:hypothetical protein QE152_g4552 [Popillia japonica]|uniref:Uncharacterized protein n=1 Tax=Popillia japonica TaxID=7064 RepID=A0AAW1MU53_POPJA
MRNKIKKLFYKALKNMRNKNEIDAMSIKSVDGKLLTEENQIMQRWKEHFEHLVNARNILQWNESEIAEKTEETDIEAITEDEVEEAVK